MYIVPLSMHSSTLTSHSRGAGGVIAAEGRRGSMWEV